jgi:hypothetical protein
MKSVGVMDEWEYSCDKCEWIHTEDERCGD